jgi:hypothetical protein
MSRGFHSWFAPGLAHGPETSDAPDGKAKVKNNSRPKADAGQPQAETRVNEHHRHYRVVEQHHGDDNA